MWRIHVFLVHDDPKYTHSISWCLLIRNLESESYIFVLVMVMPNFSSVHCILIDKYDTVLSALNALNATFLPFNLFSMTMAVFARCFLSFLLGGPSLFLNYFIIKLSMYQSICLS